MLFGGRVEGRDTASAPRWCLQHASLRCCHLLHAYHCGSMAGMKPPGEDTRSPASGTSLLVPADEVWQHPKPAAGGRDLVGLLRDPAEKTSLQAGCGFALRICTVSPWLGDTSRVTTAIRAKPNLEDAIREMTMGCVSNGLCRQVLLPQEAVGCLNTHMLVGGPCTCSLGGLVG